MQFGVFRGGYEIKDCCLLSTPMEFRGHLLHPWNVLWSTFFAVLHGCDA
jgi:hypothetical protein